LSALEWETTRTILRMAAKGHDATAIARHLALPAEDVATVYNRYANRIQGLRQIWFAGNGLDLPSCKPLKPSKDVSVTE
jgi:hypothetical protein